MKNGPVSTRPHLTPTGLVRKIAGELEEWRYDVVSIGYPGRVAGGGPTHEPGNLGDGWVSFDFKNAFGKPVRIVNDAVMQALGAFDDGRMLFLGLGTGVGSALVTEQVVVPLELGELPYPRGWQAVGQPRGGRRSRSLARPGGRK